MTSVVGVEPGIEAPVRPVRDGLPQLRQPLRERVAGDLRQRVDERALDARVGALARVADAHVDDLDALRLHAPLRLLEADEGVRAGARQQGRDERHTGILPPRGIIRPVSHRQPDPAPGAAPERGFVLAVLPQGVEADERLAELRELARAAAVEPVGELTQHRQQPDRRSYVGKGKLEELKDAYGQSGAESLLVDDELSPTQQRTLENTLNSRVVDRTQLILDIFAQHAVSAEGKLQVELAQLEYNLPRMRGMWQHLERLGGGVGTRGPGESQLETDRRIARRRVSVLKRRLDSLKLQRATRRRERQRTEAPTVALAGYTNVGKSTLLNALTDADVAVRDRLFETLDPTTRSFDFDGRRYLVTDTVGFITRLPHQLVEGFAATLEETLVADLVLHVADASASDERLDEQVEAVEAVLREIGAADLPRELVLNKTDAINRAAPQATRKPLPWLAARLGADRGGAG